jgi:hypothetical protein
MLAMRSRSVIAPGVVGEAAVDLRSTPRVLPVVAVDLVAPK